MTFRSYSFFRSLKPKQNCVDIPKEVCTRARKNPRTVKRPIIKKWCYTPKEDEDGSGDSDGEDDDDDNVTTETTTEEATLGPPVAIGGRK